MWLIRATLFGFVGFHRTAMRDTPGTSSFSNSSRFPSISGLIEANPVMFPPGRARLGTTPALQCTPVHVGPASGPAVVSGGAASETTLYQACPARQGRRATRAAAIRQRDTTDPSAARSVSADCHGRVAVTE